MMAIDKAKLLAKEEELKIEFHAIDFTKPIKLYESSLDFAYDYGLLQHIFPENRKIYVENVVHLLKAKCLSIAFSKDDTYFEANGKYRKTPAGSILYFSNLEEIEELFSPYFAIPDLKKITIPGKNGNHRAYYAFM